MLPAEFKSLQALNENTVNLLPTYQLVIDNLPDLIYWKNNNLVFQGCNSAFAKYVGLASPQEIIGKKDDELPLKNKMLTFMGNRDRDVIESNTNFEQISFSSSASEEDIWFNIHKNPLINDVGNITGILCRIEDISTHKLEESKLIESQQRRLALMVQQTPLAVIEWNRNFEIKEWNKAAEEIFGYSKSEVLGRRFHFLVTDDVKISLEEILNEFANKKEKMFSINENVTKDGKIIICEWYNYPLIAANGEVIGIASMAFDITQRKYAEEQLQEKEQFLRSIYDGADNPLIVIDVGDKGDFRYKQINPAAENSSGLKKAQFTGRTPEEVFGEVEGNRLSQSYRKCLETGTSFMFEQCLTLKNRSSWWLNTVNPLKDNSGKVYRLVSTSLDITDRRQAEIALQNSLKESADIKFALDQSSIVAITDNKGTIEYVNDKFCEISQYSREELIGKNHRIINSATHPKLFFSQMWRIISDGKVWRGEIQNRAKDRTLYWVDTTIVPMLNEKGKPEHYIAIRNDITKRKHAEIALKNSLKESADIKFALDQSAIVAITDNKGTIEYVNDKFCEISQYSREELIGKNHRIINSRNHPKSFFSQMWKTISNGKVWRGEIQNRAKDGTLYWVDTTIVPMLDDRDKPEHYIAIRNDITSRKKAETDLYQKAKDLENTLNELQRTQTKLVQSEKMSGLGQLVAGVAHEINNPVNFIYGNLNYANSYTKDLLKVIEVYRQSYPEPTVEIEELTKELDLEFLIEDLPKLLKSMKVGAQRIREIVTSLRNFSRMDEAQMKEVDIHEGIDSTLMILEHRIKAKCDRPRIEIIKDYSNLPQIECYPGQLNQVFMNILANAIDVLEEGSGGDNSPRICIKTELIECKQVKISISDNGKGISQDINSKLFDPFFTTKPVGKGTGMGLSISYQIVVEKHCGFLNYTSVVGEGTEFTINIPTRQYKNQR